MVHCAVPDFGGRTAARPPSGGLATFCACRCYTRLVPNMPTCLCGECQTCKRRVRQQRAWREHPEKMRAYQREANRKYRVANPERAAEVRRAFQKLPEQAARRRERHALRRAWLQEFKRVPCADCGCRFHPAAMDFHHVAGKDFTVSQAMTRSKEAVEAEIRRCVVLCAVCHRLRHIPEEDDANA